MKKTAAILLFLCFLPPYTGLLILDFQIGDVRRIVSERIEKGIEKHELILLRFSKEDVNKILEWEHSREFEYRGEMYDVVESRETSDSVFYTCYHDKKETKLKEKLSAYASEKNNKTPLNHNTQKRLGSFFSGLFFENLPDLNTQLHSARIGYHSNYFFNYKPVFLDRETPPPEIV